MNEKEKEEVRSIDVCDDCKFYDSINSYCRAHPPVLIKTDNPVLFKDFEYYFIWPTVDCNDWCGEYKDIWDEDE